MPKPKHIQPWGTYRDTFTKRYEQRQGDSETYDRINREARMPKPTDYMNEAIASRMEAERAQIANLIDAAPDLLKALDALVACVEGTKGNEADALVAEADPVMVLARAAIAKATGDIDAQT